MIRRLLSGVVTILIVLFLVGFFSTHGVVGTWGWIEHAGRVVYGAIHGLIRSHGKQQ